jgi:hypothetical protein
MIHHLWSILCQQALIEKDTNLVSYISSFSGLHLRGTLPASLPKLAIGTAWFRESTGKEETFQFRVLIRNPSGQKKKLRIVPVHFDPQIDNFRMNIDTTGVQVEEIGLYFFIVELLNEKTKKWKEVARLPLKITVIEPESRQSQP